MNDICLEFFLYEMTIDFDMFSSIMLNQIFLDAYCCHIITV